MNKPTLKQILKQEIRKVLNENNKKIQEGSISSKIDSFGQKISSKLGYFGSEDFLPKPIQKYIFGDKDKIKFPKANDKNKSDKKDKDKTKPQETPKDKKTLYNKLIGKIWEDNKNKIIKDLKLPNTLKFQEWGTLPTKIKKQIKDYIKLNSNKFNVDLLSMQDLPID